MRMHSIFRYTEASIRQTGADTGNAYAQVRTYGTHTTARFTSLCVGPFSVSSLYLSGDAHE